MTGTLALVSVSGRVAANLAASACYVAVTLLFYGLFKPVSRSLSLLAAFFGLAGCAIGALEAFHLAPFQINSLVLFGFYCLLIGYLIQFTSYTRGYRTYERSATEGEQLWGQACWKRWRALALVI